MGLLNSVKINKISTNLDNYYYLIQGQPKCGKTTFARDFILEMCNGNAGEGLLLATGREKGYRALDNIQAIDIETWKDFDTIIKELIQGKGKDHNIKYVFIDTYDELIPLAEKEIMRLSMIATGKQAKTFNSAFGGYGQPRIELRKLVTERLEMLNKNFGLVVIGHTKLKTIKEQGVGEEQEYQVMSSNLNADYHNIVAHKADVIATVVQEREINEKRITETKTNLYFRGNGFIEAGCRFKHIDEKIEFNAKNFIEAIKNAIEKTSQSSPAININKKEEKIEDEKVVEEDIKEEQNIQESTYELEPSTEENGMTNEELLDTIKPLFMKAESEQKATIKDIIQEYGYKKFDLSAPQEMYQRILQVFE